MNQKVIIFIAIAFILVIGGIFAWKQVKAPQTQMNGNILTPTSTTPTVPTPPTHTVIEPTPSTQNHKPPQGWKTYENEELGFELRHPEEWVVEKTDAKNGGATFAIFNKKIHEEEATIVTNTSNGTDASPHELVLMVFKFDGSIEDFIKMRYNNEISDRKGITFPITNMKGIVITDRVYPTVFTVFLSPKYAFEFFSVGGLKEVWDKYDEYKSYYGTDELDNLIISTFNFLDKQT